MHKPRQCFYTECYNATTANVLFELRCDVLKHLLEAEWLKRYTLANEVLAHGLDPMQTQRVQHGRRALHNDQDGDGEEEPTVRDQ